MSNSHKPARARRRVALPVVIAGGLSSLLLAFSLTPTFSALTASIQNTINTAGVGSIGMQETNSDGSIVCSTTASTTSATCATINKYGGSMTMKAGDTVSTTVKVTNIGSLTATSFTVQGGSCTQAPISGASIVGGATDLCGKYTVKITSNGTQVYSGTATAFASAGATSVLANSNPGAGGVTTFVISVTLDSSVGATYQGLYVSQPITFAFGA